MTTDLKIRYRLAILRLDALHAAKRAKLILVKPHPYTFAPTEEVNQQCFEVNDLGERWDRRPR